AGANASPVDLAHLHQIHLQITDLPGKELGMQAGNTIWIDLDAAGYGWYTGTTLVGAGGSVAANGTERSMDLLTVVTHEFGHVLGLADDDGSGLMGEFLPSGTRRLPAAIHPADWATGHRVITTAPGRSGARFTAVADQLSHENSPAPASASGSLA